MIQKSYDGKPKLYLIPTPIGNMDDITLRSIKIIEQVEVLFCEDTRTTGLLLNHLGIKKKMISNHKFNEQNNINKIIDYLEKGFDVGLVSDRGMPIISDPGYILTKHVAESGYNVVSLPGATAFVPALTSSSINSEHFLFYGFLNSKRNERIKELEKLKYEPYTIIFYESPHRIKESIIDLKNILGNNRDISISREITKKHEEIYRGKTSDVLEYVENIKGELVIIVSGNNLEENYDDINIHEHIDLYVKQNMKIMDAIKQVAKDRNMKKSDVYDVYHKRND